MSNLQQKVRDELLTLRLGESIREDVIEEIATRLELAVQELASSGIDWNHAESLVLSRVGDWKVLLEGIQRNKGTSMKDRFRRLWLPGLVTGVLAYTALFLIARFGSWNSIMIQGNYFPYTWPWYPALILIGALGAYWSKQAGGTRSERIFSAITPSTIMALVMFVVLPIEFGSSLIVEHQLPWVFYHPFVFVSGITAWVIVPGIPCMLGALPFLRTKASLGQNVVAA
jgi:hypothetical protein